MNKLEVRKSQALYNYAGGSIADFPEVSVMICSPDVYKTAWGTDNPNHKFNRDKVLDDRIADLFNVEYFVQPPKPNNTPRYGIRAVRFPASMFCPSCKTIHFLKELLDSEYYIERGGNKNLHFDRLNKGYFCPTCFEDSDQTQKIKLTPSRFIIANEYGLIDDFPWDWFCHRNESYRHNRKKNSKDSCYYAQKGKEGRHLKLKFGGGRASLSDMSVHCTECGAEEDLGSIFNQDETFMKKGDNYLSYTNGYMSAPWKGYSNNEDSVFYQERVEYMNVDDAEDFGKEEMAQWKRISPRTLQRGAGNVHFPITHRAISLPQESYSLEITPEMKSNFDMALKFRAEGIEFEGMNRNEMIKAILKKKDNEINKLFKQVLNEDDDVGLVKKYLRSEIKDHNALTDAEEKNRITEYKCFLEFDDKKSSPEDWCKSTILDSSEFSGIEFIDKVVLLHKLKQLNVLKGFTRVKPLALSELIFADNESELGSRPNLQQEFNRIQDIRRKPDETDWLPANVVKGEGVFLTLKNSIIEEWIESENEIGSRVNRIRKNYITNLKKFNSDFVETDFDFINVRYVLLHTLSHILIDQIAQYSGYNAASLSEIIYSNRDKENTTEEMNGILIYTSSSDAEGTLGGLVNHGQPGKLEDLFRKGVEKAKWCSSDPLCIENDKGQGFMGVNLAACHSCCMLPESCCENINRFLDRALLVGTINSPELGFFNYYNGII
ncbi:DrmB family protein [Halalkalibaculum sp. DA3122]|uniref:DrmB family protein n=1 Tax=Halalkalibaculum sp. DA3122 TaxID=3373607 RepID=UPI00375502BA